MVRTRHDVSTYPRQVIRFDWCSIRCGGPGTRYDGSEVTWCASATNKTNCYRSFVGIEYVETYEQANSLFYDGCCHSTTHHIPRSHVSIPLGVGVLVKCSVSKVHCT